MTIALQVIPDRFNGIASDLQATGNVASAYSANGLPFIRRPTRGIVIKEDTFATIRVAVADSGQSRLLVDAGSRRTDSQGPLEIDGKRATDIYSNFLLQQVQEERVEKQQILETFGEPYIFLFGQRARVISFAGILANTFDFNWEAEWWWNYDNYLRGTKCVENNAQVFIAYDNTVVGGYIISTSSTKTAIDKNYVQFQFQLFVTSYSNFSALGDPSADAGSPFAAVTDTAGQVVDPATEAAFRPVLLSSTPTTQDGQNLTDPGSLFDSIEQAVNTVDEAWTTANQVVNNVLTGVNDLLGGNNVRVPVGYSGTMAFDSEADVNLQTVGVGEPVQYTVFSDNNDEYVGVGDHYGSSNTNLLLATGLGFDNTNDELTYDQQLVQKAADVWSQFGYVMPQIQLNPVSSFIVNQGLGLIPVGSSASWASFSHTTVPGSADGSFGAGLGAALGLPF